MADREHYFANDMMRFVGGRYNLDWAPSEEWHPSSPFTALTERGAEHYLRSNDPTIVHQYCHDLHGLITDQLRFKALALQCFLKACEKLGMEKELFHSCVHVARLASLFFAEGIRNAPEVAIQVIKDVLVSYNKNCDGDIFQHFRAICLDLSAQTL